MSDKYKGIYRGQTFRLQNWDYSSEGLYFITICTQNKEHYFGEIADEKMKLSEIGEIAEKYWKAIPFQFVIMPNHVHGILIVDKYDLDTDIDRVDIIHDGVNICRDTIYRISKLISHDKSNHENKINGGITGIKNPMFHDNISWVVRWYKGRCTFEIRKIHVDFKWQSLFHDHVIRNEKAFKNIQQYIIYNPKNWNKDKF